MSVCTKICSEKMTRHVCLLYLMILIGCLFANTEDEAKNKFIATNEWQIVKKGQHIPKGLHVRINFETGITEAKLMNGNERDDDNKRALLEVPQNPEQTVISDMFKSYDDLKVAVKNIKDDGSAAAKNLDELKQFRSYEDLKKDLQELDLTPKTDAELMHDLIDKFQEVTNTNRNDKAAISILEDLEFLSHQYDNANEFVKLGGFNSIIYKNLNSSDAIIKSESLKLLGCLIQNNGKVQIHALETGSVDVLIKTLALENDALVKNRAVFALSCLLRRFPLAQKIFLDHAGLEVISKAFEAGDIKIKLKIVTFLNDLLVEHKEVVENKDSNDYTNKLVQYDNVNLNSKLLHDDNWCDRIRDMVKSVYKIDKNDHDSIEKTLTIVNFFLNDCYSSYINVKEIFKSLAVQYKSLAIDDKTNDSYFEHLYRLCNQVDDVLNKYKTEL